MALMCFSGALGAGKTLSAVYATLKHFFKHGRIVYSNIELYNVPYYPVDSFEDLNNMRESDEREAVALLDELWMIAQARVSKSIMNRITNLILLKSRKRGIHILYTAQDPKSIDRYIRNVTDHYAFPTISVDRMTCRMLLFVNNQGKLLPNSSQPQWAFETPFVYCHYNSWQEAPDFNFRDSFPLTLRLNPIWKNPSLKKGLKEFLKTNFYREEDIIYMYNEIIHTSTISLLEKLLELKDYYSNEDKEYFKATLLDVEPAFDFIYLPKINGDIKNKSFEEFLLEMRNIFIESKQQLAKHGAQRK